MSKRGRVLDIKSKWDPIPIDGAGDFEGLAAFEELVDYSLKRQTVNEQNVTKVKTKKKKSKKKNKPVVNVPEVEAVEIDENELLPWSNICVPEEISRALVEQGFKEPTEIQRLCIPAAVKGRKDLLGAAETGSGKTLAFGVPIIYGILKSRKKTDEKILYALVVTPTRELAMQIKDHLSKAVKYTGIKIAVIVGGMSLEKQTRVLDKSPEIVIGTPGRLWDLISSGHFHLANLNSLKFLAIDETDRMVEKDHYPELRSLLESINADSESTRQNFVFSATLGLVHQAPKYVKTKRKKAQNLTKEQKLQDLIDLVGMKNYKVVDVTKEKCTAVNLTEAKISCTFDEKDFYLYYLLDKYPGRTLVFCNSISSVRRLASLLNILGRSPLPLHANMEQRQRLKNLDKFKMKDDSVLLATDVAARGLDIPGIKHVIHYQVPRTAEGYIHRSGRTARADQNGITILMVEPGEVSLYTKICITLNRDTDITEFPVEQSGLKNAKEVVKLAREIDGVSLKVKKNKSNVGWVVKAAEEADIILDPDEMPNEMDNEDLGAARRFLAGKKTLLNKLISSKKRSLVDEISNVPLKKMKKVKILKKKKGDNKK